MLMSSCHSLQVFSVVSFRGFEAVKAVTFFFGISDDLFCYSVSVHSPMLSIREKENVGHGNVVTRPGVLFCCLSL
jgi:hypothetical protein